MAYRLLVLDIDGTLRPSGQPDIPHETQEALRAVQRCGVKVVLATGRGRASVPKALLGRIRPDAFICCAGAEVRDGNGEALSLTRMTPEEMYALVDFFENYEYPLRFSYTDGSYAYIGYEAFRARMLASGLDVTLRDGEDENRHLQDMPFSAYGWLPRTAAAQFDEQYGYLGLQLLFDSGESCDVLPRGVSKANGLHVVLEHFGLTAADCVAVGDGVNDIALLQAADLGVCVADGAPEALQAADRTCPPAAYCGVASLCRELWPEAFPHG